MADVFAPSPVKTKTNGDIVAAIVDSAGTNKASVSAAGAVKVDNSGVTQPISVTGNLATNVAQINTVTPLMGNGVTGTGSQRVTVASDNTPFAVKIDQTTPGTTNLVALGANQSVNVAQINGVTALMGNGVTGTGSQRVTIASDNTAFAVNATLQTGANTIGALTANQSVNNNQIAGAAISTGNGVTGTGSQRVTIASDNSAIAVTQGLTGTTQDSGHLTSASLAAGATVTLDSTQIASGTGKVYEATVSSSVALKAQLGTWDGTTFVVFRTFFVPSNAPFVYIPARYDSITKATGATAKFRWSITNNDNVNAADVYASITYAN